MYVYDCICVWFMPRASIGSVGRSHVGTAGTASSSTHAISAVNHEGKGFKKHSLLHALGHNASHAGAKETCLGAHFAQSWRFFRTLVHFRHNYIILYMHACITSGPPASSNSFSSGVQNVLRGLSFTFSNIATFCCRAVLSRRRICSSLAQFSESILSKRQLRLGLFAVPHLSTYAARLLFFISGSRNLWDHLQCSPCHRPGSTD